MDSTDALGHQLISRLDDDYLFLLQFVNRPMQSLPEGQQNLAKKWLEKLGTEAETRSCAAKLGRNVYLARLIECMLGGNLKKPFDDPPKVGELPSEDMDLPYLAHPTEHPEWLDRLMMQVAGIVHVGGRNFETYLATKLFADGRGACAYLAVSVQNEGDEAAWINIQPNRERDGQIHRMFVKEMEKLEDQEDFF